MDSGVFNGDELIKIGYFAPDFKYSNIFFVNIHWLSADALAEEINGVLRLILAGYGMYITINLLFLNANAPSVIVFDMAIIGVIFGAIILSLAVDAYGLLVASLNLSMYS